MEITRVPKASAQPKIGIFALDLSRHLVVNHDTARLLHNKALKTMTERDQADGLRGKIQTAAISFRTAVDDDLVGEHPSGQAGRVWENKVPIVAAISP